MRFENYPFQFLHNMANCRLRQSCYIRSLPLSSLWLWGHGPNPYTAPADTSELEIPRARTVKLYWTQPIIKIITKKEFRKGRWPIRISFKYVLDSPTPPSTLQSIPLLPSVSTFAGVYNSGEIRKLQNAHYSRGRLRIATTHDQCGIGYRNLHVFPFVRRAWSY